MTFEEWQKQHPEQPDATIEDAVYELSEVIEECLIRHEPQRGTQALRDLVDLFLEVARV